MSGLTEDQWEKVEKRLLSIDSIVGAATHINNELIDMRTSVDKIQVEIAIINTELFGKSGNNGIKGTIKEIKGRTAGKIFKGWLPVIVCILLFIATLYGWVRDGITNNIKQQTPIIAPAQPTP